MGVILINDKYVPRPEYCGLCGRIHSGACQPHRAEEIHRKSYRKSYKRKRKK
jgi:hypothetical protein